MESELAKALRGFQVPELHPVMPEIRMPELPRNLLLELAEANTAKEFHKRLLSYVKRFEESLSQELEVGMRLVSFGQAITFHVTDIGYWNPSLISFDGFLDDGSPVQLIQHVSQISFLLTALKRADPSQPRRKFGFCSDSQDEAATPPA